MVRLGHVDDAAFALVDSEVRWHMSKFGASQVHLSFRHLGLDLGPSKQTTVTSYIRYSFPLGQRYNWCFPSETASDPPTKNCHTHIDPSTLRIDRATRMNVGYAFVNFVNPDSFRRLNWIFSVQSRVPSRRRPTTVSKACIQKQHAN